MGLAEAVALAVGAAESVAASAAEAQVDAPDRAEVWAVLVADLVVEEEVSIQIAKTNQISRKPIIQRFRIAIGPEKKRMRRERQKMTSKRQPIPTNRRWK